MNDEERQRQWANLEALMLQILDTIGDKLPSGDARLVNEFVENREYGVALDWLQSIIAERHIPITETTKRDIDIASKLMDRRSHK